MKKIYIAPESLKDRYGIGMLGWTHMIGWCREQWPSKEYNYLMQGDGWEFSGQGVFKFTDEEKLTFFLLRWA